MNQVEEIQGRKLQADRVEDFVFGGNALFTVRNERTGTRFTFKVVKGKRDGAPYFVRVLVGSNNESDYAYIGHVWENSREYVHGRKSRISEDAPSAIYADWLFKRMRGIRSGAVEDFGSAEIWHEGRCCSCGRVLTDPESIERGIGPVCANK